ncbi:hypothetical protein ACFOND_13680 [Reinekea marina]|uniref:Outer membrane protein beta-barrel domain-containing protein n=2 Tax=Reinekea marina TaxID=1310421 RepID=A0ABV7WTR2_9GAMM
MTFINKSLGLSVLTLTVALSGAAMAKDTLIDVENARIGGFGGPVFKASQIKNTETFELGGMGGATFTTGKHSIMIGGGGYGLVNEISWGVNTQLEMGYGGLMVGYTYNPEALIHVDTFLMLGAGGASVIDSRNANNPEELGSFLVTELTSQIEINVTDFMEVGIGASYRLTTDPDITGLSAADLSKPGVHISFQFGSL